MLLRIIDASYYILETCLIAAMRNAHLRRMLNIYYHFERDSFSGTTRQSLHEERMLTYKALYGKFSKDAKIYYASQTFKLDYFEARQTALF